MHSANILLLIFTVLCIGSTVLAMPGALLINENQLDKDSDDTSKKKQQNHELMMSENQPVNITILQRGLRAPQFPPEYIFEEYGRGLALLNMMVAEDYKEAVKELFQNDTASLRKILSYADTLPEDGQAFAMYTELYELMVHNKYDRIEDYIDMWYMMEDKPRLDSKWSVLSQNLTRTVAERMQMDSKKLCWPNGYNNFTWINHMIKKDDVQGLLFRKSIEQLYDINKATGKDCLEHLLYKWEEIMPETSDWVYKYVLTFDVLALRVIGLDKVQNMFRAKYSDTENSLRNQYIYKLTVSMYAIIESDSLDEATFDRLLILTNINADNIKKAASVDKVCLRSNLTNHYLWVSPMPDGVNWKADVKLRGDVSSRGQWRITPVHDAGDGFYLTNVYTGLDFSVLMNNAEYGSASSGNASRTVYTFYGGNAFVTLAERDTKRKLAIVDYGLKMLPADDKNYYKWTIEGC